MAELGKWEHARNWVIGSFRQHTSRDGDPQLHVHNLVLAKVVTERDGQWRKLDSKALYRFQGAAAAIAAAVMETALTRMFGVAWVPRRGRARAGDRRDQPGADGRVLVPAPDHHRSRPGGSRIEREAEHGRRPDARQMDRIQRDLALRTRPPKPGEPLDLRAKLREWEAQRPRAGPGRAGRDPGRRGRGGAADARSASARSRSGRTRRCRSRLSCRSDARGGSEHRGEFERQHGRAPDQAELARHGAVRPLRDPARSRDPAG